MPHARTTHSKNTKKPSVQIRERPAAKADEIILAAPVLNDKKGFDFDEEATVAAIDKPEEADPLEPGTSEEETSEEEAGLDEEELNPFGDKWEV